MKAGTPDTGSFLPSVFHLHFIQTLSHRPHSSAADLLPGCLLCVNSYFHKALNWVNQAVGNESVTERAQWIVVICGPETSTGIFLLVKPAKTCFSPGNDSVCSSIHYISRKLESICVCSRNQFVCIDAQLHLCPRTIRPKNNLCANSWVRLLANQSNRSVWSLHLSPETQQQKQLEMKR